MATITSTTSGNWNDGATWVGGVAPARTGTLQHVVIDSGDTVTLQQDEYAISLTTSGTLAGGSGYAINVSGEGDGSDGTNGYAVRAHSGSTITGEVNLVITTQAPTWTTLNGGTGNFHDLTINHASCEFILQGAADLTGNLTIAAGELDTHSNNYALTVTGTVTLAAGDLLLNASAVTIGGFSVTGDGEMTGTTHADGLIVLGNWRSAGSRFNNADGKVVFKGTSGGTIAMNGAGSTGDGFYDLEINIAGQTYSVAEWDLTGIERNLTITAGTLDTNSTHNHTLTVTGKTELNGSGATLTLNDSTCSFGSGATVGGLTVSAGSTTVTAGGSSNITLGSIYASYDGSVNIRLEGTNTVNSYDASNDRIIRLPDATVDADSAFTVTTTTTDKRLSVYDANISLTLTPSSATNYFIYNVNGMDVKALTINANATLNCKNTASGSDRNLTVDGDVSVTGTLTGNTSAISMGSLTIASGGTYSATSGTTTIDNETSDLSLSNAGTFTHNNGTLAITSQQNSGIKTGSSKLYDLLINAVGVNTIYIENDTEILNNFTIKTGRVRAHNVAGSTNYALTVRGNTLVTYHTLDLKDTNHTFDGVVAVASTGILTLSTGTNNMNGGIRNLGGTIN